MRYLVLPHWLFFVILVPVLIVMVIFEVKAVRYGRRRWPVRILLGAFIIGLHVFLHHQHETQAEALDSPKADPVGHYAAIAYSRSTGEHGAASECRTLVEAEQLAKERCKATDAQVVTWAPAGTWCALAVGADRSFGFAHEHSRAQAEHQALMHCRHDAKTSCKVVAVVFAGGATPAPTPANGGYAAIAYSPSTGVHGAAGKCHDLPEAERLALERCKEPDARIVVWSHHCWCALAVAEDRAYGFGWAATAEEARRLALEHCRAHSSTPGRIAVTVDGGPTATRKEE